MSPWLVSRRFDLSMFLAPALVALALVPLGRWIAPDGDTPFPMWIVCVLLVDVAHVWATLYRTYLDTDALRRRPVLYLGAPIVAYAFGLALSSISVAAFWTGLAYLAVFHFVRQQYGWVALYNRKDDRLHRVDRWLDGATIYAATCFPIVWWHAHLDRRFHWFVPGDFAATFASEKLVRVLWPLYVGVFVVYVARQVVRLREGVPLRVGKHIVVATTAACWGVGIIATNSDWAFTVTNVLIHGVPYFGIVWVYGRRESGRTLAARVLGAGVLPFYGVLAFLAFAEELTWDRLFWHSDHPIFFGPKVDLSETAAMVLLPLLAVPQVTHYILDGFIWRRVRTPSEAATPATGVDADPVGVDG